jgi:hypothetical protein
MEGQEEGGREGILVGRPGAGGRQANATGPYLDVQ